MASQPLFSGTDFDTTPNAPELIVDQSTRVESDIRYFGKGSSCRKALFVTDWVWIDLRLS